MSEEVVEVKEVKENQLVIAVRESGLDQTKAQVLLDKFTDYFDIAAKWENTAKGLVITSVDQKAEMKMAREGRLFLQKKRTDIEKTRKQLKESSLREGQTIDAIAKILTNLIVPIENDLEQKEKFAELQEAQRKAELKAAREIELQPYSEFVPLGIDLGAMDDANYQVILNGAILQRQAKLDAEAKAAAEAAEQERIAQLHCTRLLIVRPFWQFLSESESMINFGKLSEAEFNSFIDKLKAAKKEYDEKQAAIEAENKRLKREQEEKEQKLAEDRKKAEAEHNRLVALRSTVAIDFLASVGYKKCNGGMEATEYQHFIGSLHYTVFDSDNELEAFKREIIAIKEREQARKAAEKAAADKKMLEDELREKAEAEEAARKTEENRIAAERKAKENAERKAANATDKEKLQTVINRIAELKETLPEVSGIDAKVIINDVCVLFDKIVAFIQNKSSKI